MNPRVGFWLLPVLIGGLVGVLASGVLPTIFRFGVVASALLCGVGALMARWTLNEFRAPNARHQAFSRADIISSIVGGVLTLVLASFVGFGG